MAKSAMELNAQARQKIWALCPSIHPHEHGFFNHPQSSLVLGPSQSKKIDWQKAPPHSNSDWLKIYS
jgi:hypothetical protein